MRRVTNEEEIKASIFNPPETTRAFFRGRAVARFNDEISSIQWDEIVFTNQANSFRVALPEAAMNVRWMRSIMPPATARISLSS